MFCSQKISIRRFIYFLLIFKRRMNVVLALRLMNEFVFDYLEVNKYLFAGQ